MSDEESEVRKVKLPKYSIGQRTYIVSKGRKEVYHYCGSGFVGQVQTSFYDNHIHNCNKTDEITYMLSTTGIGTGTVYNETSLFASKQEAMDFCLKQNGMRKKEK